MRSSGMSISGMATRFTWLLHIIRRLPSLKAASAGRFVQIQVIRLGAWWKLKEVFHIADVAALPGYKERDPQIVEPVELGGIRYFPRRSYLEG